MGIVIVYPTTEKTKISDIPQNKSIYYHYVLRDCRMLITNYKQVSAAIKPDTALPISNKYTLLATQTQFIQINAEKSKANPPNNK